MRVDDDRARRRKDDRAGFSLLVVEYQRLYQLQALAIGFAAVMLRATAGSVSDATERDVADG